MVPAERVVQVRGKRDAEKPQCEHVFPQSGTRCCSSSLPGESACYRHAENTAQRGWQAKKITRWLRTADDVRGKTPGEIADLIEAGAPWEDTQS